MAADSTFFEVLELDLRALSAEARKTDSIATQITGWLSHTDFPQIKESAERAVLKLRSITQEKKGVGAIRTAREILRPFLLVCESKNPRLIGLVLGSIQKLLANDAVSEEGRRLVIQALNQVERSHDDNVKLKILQTALTLLQNPSYADDEDAAGHILSICFRTYCNNKSNPTVVSTAAATIRQAVAIVFDHAVLPAASAGAVVAAAGSSSGRESAALNLLRDLCEMCNGVSPSWLKCPVVSRLFVLDLLEFVLHHRPQAFHSNSQFTSSLQTKVCPLLESLSQAALDPEVDPSTLGECKLVLRCIGALLRQHASLLPERAPALLMTLLTGCSTNRMPWQRLLSLQAIRWLAGDALLLYALFRSYDMSIHHDINAVHDTLRVVIDIIKSYIKLADAGYDDDMLAPLNSLYVAKSAGKEVILDVESLGSALVSSTGAAAVVTAETWMAYLALETLLAVVSDIESLTDMVVDNDPELPSPSLRVNSKISVDTCSTMVDVLWRQVLTGLSCVLAKTSHEATVLALLKGYQSYAYSAGALHERTARDGFLASLCEFTIAPPEEALLQQQAEAMAAAAVSGNTPSSADAQLPGAAAAPVLGPKNIHALRTLFNIAHRLADVLGPSWIHLVEVLNTLDKTLSAKAKDASLEANDPGTAPSELFILATAANQLFETSSLMSTDAVVSLLSALAEVSFKSLTLAAGVGVPKLAALNRMVETILYNVYRIQDLWGIFLAHVMEVLHSGNSHIRAAATDALDRTLTGALGPQPTPPEHYLHHHHGKSRSGSISETGGFGRGSSEGGSDRNVTVGRGGLQGGSHHGPTGRQSQGSPDAASNGQQGHHISTTAPAAAPAAVAASLAPPTGEGIEHMLLVALESMYKEEREPDVRQGLLRVALHVLQRHGDHLSRGWVPLLRLLEAVPSWEDSATINMAFQSVESICSDFLTTMPKEHIERALEVLHLFAAQKAVMNISLTAIGLLWNVTDTLGRSRPASAALPAVPAAPASSTTMSLGSSLAATIGRLGSFSISTSPSRSSTTDETPSAPSPGSTRSSSYNGAAGGALPAAPSASGSLNSSMGAGGLSALIPTGGDSHSARSDLMEAECTELLLRVFKHLRNLSMDGRPEVRNSGIRTLFLAIGGQASRFDAATWRYCLWEIMFPLVTYVHVMGDTSSSEEAAAVELGKEKGGKAVMMLMHHSRNTEQKQWDETTVLALNGIAKVLRSHMGSMLVMEGFDDKWNGLMDICAKVLAHGRKNVAVAAAQLLTGVLLSYKPSGSGRAAYPWKRALAAIDTGVTAMAVPMTRVPLQARTELLNGLASVYQAQKEVFDLQDTLLLLKWVDAFVRYPVGADDVTPVHGVLPPVQKSVLAVLGHLCPVVLPDAWPVVLTTLSGFLSPFMAITQQQQEAAAATSSNKAAGGRESPVSSSATSPLLNGSSDAHELPSTSAPSTPHAAPHQHHHVGRAHLSSPKSMKGARWLSTKDHKPLPCHAKMLTHQWMSSIISQLLVMYRDHAGWQVRAKMFAMVLAALAECMATRYITPDDDLWRHATTAFSAIVNAGLPAVNIAYVNHQYPPENTWQAVAAAFEMFLLAEHIPKHLPQQQQPLQQTYSSSSEGQPPKVSMSHARSKSETSSTLVAAVNDLHKQQGQHSKQAGGESDNELQALVLETLTDGVLTTCGTAPHDVRQRLVAAIASGAAMQQPGDSSIAASSRFSHMCLCKLQVLSSRGTELQGSNRSLLEVAQLALPALLDRCEAVLEAYAAAQEGTPPDSSTQQHRAGLDEPSSINSGDLSSSDTDDVVCVLEALSSMRLDPAVMDAAVLHRPHLAPWLEIARLRRGFDDVCQKEQTHLLALYTSLAKCVGCRDAVVRGLLRDIMVTVGSVLGLTVASTEHDGDSVGHHELSLGGGPSAHVSSSSRRSSDSGGTIKLR